MPVLAAEAGLKGCFIPRTSNGEREFGSEGMCFDSGTEIFSKDAGFHLRIPFPGTIEDLFFFCKK
jgi:hypothetical protein